MSTGISHMAPDGQPRGRTRRHAPRPATSTCRHAPGPAVRTLRGAPRPRVATVVAWVALSVFAAGTARADEIVSLTTDFVTGSVSILDLVSPWSADVDVADICSDAIARLHDEKIYVVGRACGSIQVLDPAAGYTVVQEFSVGAGSNPQDIVFAGGGRAFVSLYELPWLIEVDLATETIVDSVSLAPLADADGVPEMSRMWLEGDELFVQVQRLDRNGGFEPVAPSYLAVVDVTSNTLLDVDGSAAGVQGIELAVTNPNGAMERDLLTGDLLVPVSGSFFGPPDGGIELVDLASRVTRGLVAAEAELGGEVNHFAQWSGSRAYAIVSDDSFVTHLVAFDPSDGSFIETVYSSAGFDLADCVTAAEGFLYLADRDPVEPGVRVFEAENGNAVSGSIPLGLPPFELLVQRPAVSDAPRPEPIAAGVFAIAPHPNPSTGHVRFQLQGGRNDLRVAVFDALGATVRDLAPGSTEWNGRDAAGRRVPAGAYFLRATDGQATESRALRLLR